MCKPWVAVQSSGGANFASNHHGCSSVSLAICISTQCYTWVEVWPALGMSMCSHRDNGVIPFALMIRNLFFRGSYSLAAV